jgi:hypothetical protein
MVRVFYAGPKMYNADGSVQDENHHGSTKLHMDVTDALNVMTWTADLPDGSPGYAIWHIFLAIHVPILRQFLREEGFIGPGDSIHSQYIYITLQMLKRLFDKYGIKPYIIRQNMHECVFIPAGCPHQVCQLLHCYYSCRKLI